MSKRTVIISDTQVPFHDRKAMKAVIRFIGDTQPDQVIHIGDILDLPQPSRWTKGTRGEFEGSVMQDAETCKKQLIAPLRELYDGPIMMHEGNHDERGRVYLEKYAPALSESRAFHIDTLLDFDGYGIELLPEFYNIAPGWVTTHGHRGGIRLSQIAGNTALNAAKRFGSSVIMGHTHRLARASFTTGYGGKAHQVLTGVEIGNLMDMTLATYLKGGTANWQQGFGIVETDGKTTQADVVQITGKKFIVDGETWSLT